MSIWQIEKAKTHLSEVIGQASREGPQIINRHGSECAIVLSVADFRALTAHKPDLRDYLLGGPKVDSFKVNRECDTGRSNALQQAHHRT